MPVVSLVPPDLSASRRGFIAGAGRMTLSAAAVGLLAGCGGGVSGLSRDEARSGSSLPPGTATGPMPEDVASDIRILNMALGAEYQAIAAYQVGSQSGLLRPDIATLAIRFQGDHTQHAQLLTATVTRLGGTPVQAKPVASYNFPVASLHDQADLLRFAAGLEKAAASAYLASVPQFADRDLAHAAASILGDESIHWALLLTALAENPDPSPFIS